MLVLLVFMLTGFLKKIPVFLFIEFYSRWVLEKDTAMPFPYEYDVQLMLGEYFSCQWEYNSQYQQAES